MASLRSFFASASTLSLPPPPPVIQYQVFISFRGKDTRNNFTSHLHKAFCEKGINAFIDNQLRSGDEISRLLQVIEESQISVIIFSANYANSIWCLKELVKILECYENHRQIVIPVFHEIDPSDVKNQTGSYEVAFDNHEQCFKENLDEVQQWRRALKQAARLCGFDSSVVKPEAKLIENIVKAVWERLKNMRKPQCDNKNLVGIDSRIKELETMLGRGTVGIWGFGGIGKTALAKALLEKISCEFDASYFVEEVRKASKGGYELTHLRQKLFSKLLGDENARICTFMEKLKRKKFLIILDDVSDFNQVEIFIENPRCLDLKSQIIIISKDKQVLRNCCMDDNIYEVKELCFSDALNLFCYHAFRQNHPDVKYMELSSRIVKIVGGVPLALKVLGLSLAGKPEEVWESALEKFGKNFNESVHEALKISYEELNGDQQDIFLDIACFFKRWNIGCVKAFMKACDFFPDDEIDALIDKSLITVSNNMVTMHDLLQAMGKEIVRQESTSNPGQRSRLWHHKEIYEVLTNNTGTVNLQGISLDMSKSEDIYLHPLTFAKMQNLRFLNFYTSRYSENRVHVSRGLQSIFTNLRYLSWYGCPLKSLQSNVLSKNLVELRMNNSKLKELWSGSPQLDNLKTIDLSWSQHLTRLPDLSKATNLEYLYLFHCTNLMSIPDSNGLKSLIYIRVDHCYKLKVAPKLSNNFEALFFIDLTSLCEIPSSYKYFDNLEYLGFIRCKSLTSIPDYSGFKNLKCLEITGIPKLKLLPEFPNTIVILTLEDIPIKELPSSLENLCRLSALYLHGCSRLKSLPSSVCKLKTLETLSLRNCSKIDKLPEGLGCLTSLGHLHLEKINFESIPESIINLSKLTFLDISYCNRVKVLPKLPWASIWALNCTSLEQISCPSFHNDMFAPPAGGYLIANFLNCFKLNRNSLDNFLKGSLLEVQRQAEKISYHQVDQGFQPPIWIRYPDSEIPVWFKYQNRGSFIDVNLPPNWFNYNFLCFALCIVLAIPDRQSTYDGENLDNLFCVSCKCSLKSKDGDRPAVINDIIHWESSPIWNHKIRSNHVEIGFGFHFFSEFYVNQLSFQFYIEDNIDNYKVEKCGVHLMSGQHLEILGEKEEDDEPWLEESDEDDNELILSESN